MTRLKAVPMCRFGESRINEDDRFGAYNSNFDLGC